jgi:hypothetical protein
VAYQIAPYQNGMVTIMIPQIRFSDRPLSTIEPLRVDNRGEYVAIPEGFSGFFSSDFEEVLKINLAIAEMNKLDQNHAPDN